MGKKGVRTIEVLVILAALSIFIASPALAAAPPKAIKIGITAPLTGPAAEAGVALKQGFILAMTVLLEYLREFGEYRFMIYGAMLVATIMFMPKGVANKIFPEKE